MFQLYFTTVGQSVTFKIDKENKIVKVKSQKTEYKFKRKPWSSLADKGIIWLSPPKNTNTGLNKIPFTFEDLRKRRIRMVHKLSNSDVIKLKIKNDNEWEKELDKINNMSEKELKNEIINKMKDVGYKYVGSK